MYCRNDLKYSCCKIKFLMIFVIICVIIVIDREIGLLRREVSV